MLDWSGRGSPCIKYIWLRECIRLGYRVWLGSHRIHWVYARQEICALSLVGGDPNMCCRDNIRRIRFYELFTGSTYNFFEALVISMELMR